METKVNVIAKAIWERHETVAKIADDLGYSRGAVYRWISGEALPDRENMNRVCRYLGISPNEVYGYKK